MNRLVGFGQLLVDRCNEIEKTKEAYHFEEIGRAIGRALQNNEYCIASYKGKHITSMKTVDELLSWYREEL